MSGIAWPAASARKSTTRLRDASHGVVANPPRAPVSRMVNARAQPLECRCARLLLRLPVSTAVRWPPLDVIGQRPSRDPAPRLCRPRAGIGAARPVPVLFYAPVPSRRWARVRPAPPHCDWPGRLDE